MFRNQLVGILYRSEDSFFIHPASPGKDASLDDLFRRVEGEEVRVFLQNEPGGCRWQGSALCPAGHRDNPDLILTFQKQGTLHRVKDAWKVGTHAVPLYLYEGHVCRFEIFPSAANLRDRALRMQSLLQKVRSL